MKKLTVVSVIVLQFFILSCSRESDQTANLKIVLPSYTPFNSTAQNVAILESASTNQEWNTALNPTVLSDINCYAVFVNGPEASMQNGYCSRTDTGVEVFRFGREAGFFPAGTEISLQVPFGDNKEVILVGLKSQNGACKNFVNEDPDFSNLSYPHVLGKTQFSMTTDNQTVNINASLDTSSFFTDCTSINGGTGGGNSGDSLFGDGRDGSITIENDVTDGSSITLGSFSSYSPDPTANLPSTKIVSANRRVITISPDGKTLGFAATFTSSEFEPGDEVLWHVSAGDHASNQDCGGELFRGFWNFSKITATDTGAKTISISTPVSNNPAAITSTMISETTASIDSIDFCRVQVLRVPSFKKITISSVASWKALAFQLSNSGAGTGGIIAFRAQEIDLTSGAFTVDAEGLGFQSVPYRSGTGLEGLDNSSNGTYPSASTGGTGHSTQAGGGGNTGTGGSSTSVIGGSDLKHCIGNTSCLPIRDQKMFFGGAGGAFDSILGGAGGGAIILHVGTITGANSFHVKANGSGGSSASGAGAGGAVHLTLKEAPLSNVTVQANGGTGVSTAGAGGGGSAELAYCSTKVIPVPSVSASAGVGATGPRDGGIGEALSSIEPTLCEAQ